MFAALIILPPFLGFFDDELAEVGGRPDLAELVDNNPHGGIGAAACCQLSDEFYGTAG
jgi:hypothetical protein